MSPDRITALRNLAGQDCSGLPRPSRLVYRTLEDEGLARVIDEGDAVRWAITEAGHRALVVASREAPESEGT